MRCTSLFRLLVIAPLVLFTACASVSAGADFDRGIRLEQYRTFDWGGGDTLPVGDPRLDNNPFFDARVRAAVERELTAKGLTRATAKPDLLVHYHASIRQRVDVMRADEIRGYTYYGGRTPDKVVEFDEGTLILDVAEAGAKRILWRGWAQTDVGGLLNDPREMEKRLNESLRMMMRRFPRTP
jgi:Domain of unknown function (DUF4136)